MELSEVVTLKKEFFRAIVAALVSLKPKPEALREVVKGKIAIRFR